MPGAAPKQGKLLRLAAARQVFRRLFPFRGRRQPGDDSEPENSGSDISGLDGLNLPSVPPNTPSSDYAASLAEAQVEQPPSQQVDSDKSQHYSHFGDDDDFESDDYNDSSTMSDSNAARSAGASRHAAAGGEAQNQDQDQQPRDDGRVDALTEQMASTTVAAVDKEPEAQGDEEVVDISRVDPEVLAERAEHIKFMNEALNMARLALVTNETPVGCVIVHKGEVIARGMNATNVTRNGTRHAEFMAISALLSVASKDGPRTTCLRPKVPPTVPEGKESDPAFAQEWRCPDEGNEDGSKGHLYPYGQKMVSTERVDQSILKESILYVTVEPCVMCASLLRQLHIKKVYFGAVNDKFGGTGGVFKIHANGLPPGTTTSLRPEPKRIPFPDGGGSLGVSYPIGGGDGGNAEPGYEIEGGWSRDEAVGLLRRFYVQENGRAPVPRKKEGRAARLAAMMELEGSTTPSEVDVPAKKASATTLKENVGPANMDDNVQVSLKDEAGNLEAPLNDEAGNVEAPLKDEAGTLEAPLKDKDDNLEAPLKDKDDNLEAPLKVKDDNLQDSPKVKAGNLQDSPKVKENLQASLKGKAGNLQASPKVKAGDLEAPLKDKAGNLQDSPKVKENLQASLKGKAGNLQASLKGKAGNLQASLKGKARNLQASLKGKEVE